jgi:DNA ligase D-like protein (predicted 3'-phosphoesterase)
MLGLRFYDRATLPLAVFARHEATIKIMRSHSCTVRTMAGSSPAVFLLVGLCANTELNQETRAMVKRSRSQPVDPNRFGRLAEYNRKRRFGVTPEPAGKTGRVRKKELEFVVQKHRASRLHYDFRLEHDGVMLSWAVPKGPSLDPSNKRFAMQTENHPIEYNRFEGVIPEGEYGGGTVMIWDRGTWEPEVEDVGRALEKGELKFRLYGRKLRGSWVLVRMRDRQWLLIKHRDEATSTQEITAAKPRSVVSRRTLAGIARAAGASSRQLVQAKEADMAPATSAR